MKSGRTIWKQMIVALAAVVLVGVMAVAFPKPAFAADNIASGSYGDTTWVIDANGKLTVTGTGNVGRGNYYGIKAPQWCSYRGKIKTAEINVTGMTDASNLFWECSNLVSVDLSQFDTSKVTDMYAMFNYCSSLTTLDVSGLDTSNVTDMSNMFSNCSNLTVLDVSEFDTGNVTSMGCMFYDCSNLTALDVSGFDTSNVIYMDFMFYDCSSLTALDVSGFDTSNVTRMTSMFLRCSGLTALDVSNFDTGSVKDMESMFLGCSGVTELDLSHFDMNEENSATRSMFYGCDSLTTIYSPRYVSRKIELPSSSDNVSYIYDGTIWYLSDGTAITSLPQNLSYSVAIGKNYIPTEKNATKLTTKNTTIKLSKKSYTYNGKAKKPTVKVCNSKGKVLKSKYYTVTYKNNTKVGKATLTIKFKGKYTGKIKATYTIKPKATKLTGTSAKKKSVTLTWKKQTKQVTGYQIQYATNSKFTKNKTTVLVKGAKKSSETITGLSGKTKYYFRIRTYKTVSGKKYYSAWSKALSAKTK